MLHTIKNWIYTGPDLNLDFDDISVPETKLPAEFTPSKAMQDQFRQACVELGYMKMG